MWWPESASVIIFDASRFCYIFFDERGSVGLGIVGVFPYMALPLSSTFCLLPIFIAGVHRWLSPQPE